MTDIIKNDLLEAKNVLEEFLASDSSVQRIELAGKIMVKTLNNGNKIISCGNGGSMSDAMHFAEELSGKFRNNRKALAAIAISDPSHLTCVANDFGFDYIFSRFIEAMGNKGDVLLAISTSGNSVNVINAAISAKSNDLTVVALTGKDGGRLSALCDIEIRAPHSEFTDRIQEIHIKIIHALIHYIECNI
jgi:D-sedoheptulose 7-phosphate isomerase